MRELDCRRCGGYATGAKDRRVGRYRYGRLLDDASDDVGGLVKPG